MKVVAHDGVGLTAESFSSLPFSIIIEYPRLIHSPSIISQRDSIRLYFSQSIDTDKFTGGIPIIGDVIENYDIRYEFENENRAAVLFCEHSFASADTLSIILKADQVTNIFGYGLDGNQNGAFEGAPADNDTVEISVRYSADFDGNDQIDWDDLVILSDAWYGRDYRYELGPVLGEPPHFQIVSDSLFNIEDAMTFGRMWNWQASLGKRSISLPKTMIGKDFSTEQIGNTIVLHCLPATGKRFVFQYDPELITINRKTNGLSKPSAQSIDLSTELPDSGYLEFVSFSFDREPIDISQSFIIHSEEREPVEIEVGYEGLDNRGKLVQASLQTVRFQPVPDSYELFTNYPNPFNSTTVIEYAVPAPSDVSVVIYDLRGYKIRTLADSPHPAHYYRRIWDGKDDNGRQIASGLYFLRIVAIGDKRSFTKSQKMILLR